MSGSAGHALCTRRGVTLVEMLATLGLLVVLMLVSVSWVTHITKRQRQDRARANWEHAAHMVFDQIERDLMQTELLDEANQRGEGRVSVHEDHLDVRVLNRGVLITVRYQFDPTSKEVRRILPESRASGVPLLGTVRDVRVELQMPDEDHALPELRLEIESQGDQRMARVFPLSREDVRR